MFSIEQGFLVNGKAHKINVCEKDFELFKKKYFEVTRSLTIDEIVDYSVNPDQKTRIIVDIFYEDEDDFRKKEKVVRSFGPIFEIALDNTYQENDDRYLLKYRKQGAYFEKEDGYFRFSLGDSNEPSISFSMIALVYALIYEGIILQKLDEKFERITPAIIDGGYNSASFNGLQGYYFSNYFVKWLLDIKSLANKYSSIDGAEFDPLYALIWNLENPKDAMLNNKNI
ncbi:MAG: hypothetical protein GXY87_01535 [Tissierellia bacterium]|nr:hypothetical protein [Tissierellia bacterium]